MPLKVHGADTELYIHKALWHLKNSRASTTNPQPATKLIPTHSTTTLDWGNQNNCGQPRLQTVVSFTPNTPLNLWTYILSDNLQRMVSFKLSPQRNQLPATWGSHQSENHKPVTFLLDLIEHIEVIIVGWGHRVTRWNCLKPEEHEGADEHNSIIAILLEADEHMWAAEDFLSVLQERHKGLLASLGQVHNG